MNTLIFRTMAPILGTVMVLVSLVLLLRGHNAPGGGFVGGLLAAAAVAVYAMAFGVGPTRRRLGLDPLQLCGIGVLLSTASGLLSLAAGAPFLTGLWLPADLFGTPGLFDVGVYLTVAGAVSALALGLEDHGEAG